MPICKEAWITRLWLIGPSHCSSDYTADTVQEEYSELLTGQPCMLSLLRTLAENSVISVDHAI